jgi:hypothetical protein
VVIVTDDPQTTVGIPELLIEEARRRQRQRLRRRAAVLGIAAILAGLGLGIDQLVGAGGKSATGGSGPAAAAGSGAAVIYEKLETVKLAAQLPTERRTSEIWSATNEPLRYRELLTVAGGPSVEIGAGPGYEQTLGLPEQVVYLYSASKDTIYETGAYDVPLQPDPALALSPRRFVERLLAEHRVRLVDKTVLEGRPVLVIESSRGWPRTDYLDARSYLPVKSILVDGTATIIQRTLVRKTLPATKANLDRTRLATSHPGAHIAQASPRIDRLYAEAIGGPGLISLSRVDWRQLILSQTES